MCAGMGRSRRNVSEGAVRDMVRAEIIKDHACEAKKFEFILKTVGSF